MSMNITEMIAVLEATRAGKVIEHRPKQGIEGRPWVKLTYTDAWWNFDRYDYRVQPEPPKPREFYLIKQTNCSHGSAIDGQCGWHAYTAEDSLTREGTIRVREVLE